MAAGYFTVLRLVPYLTGVFLRSLGISIAMILAIHLMPVILFCGIPILEHWGRMPIFIFGSKLINYTNSFLMEPRSLLRVFGANFLASERMYVLLLVGSQKKPANRGYLDQ